jgi:hypothetical protein
LEWEYSRAGVKENYIGTNNQSRDLIRHAFFGGELRPRKFNINFAVKEHGIRRQTGSKPFHFPSPHSVLYSLLIWVVCVQNQWVLEDLDATQKILIENG